MRVVAVSSPAEPLTLPLAPGSLLRDYRLCQVSTANAGWQHIAYKLH